MQEICVRLLGFFWARRWCTDLTCFVDGDGYQRLRSKKGTNDPDFWERGDMYEPGDDEKERWSSKLMISSLTER